MELGDKARFGRGLSSRFREKCKKDSCPVGRQILRSENYGVRGVNLRNSGRVKVECLRMARGRRLLSFAKSKQAPNLSRCRIASRRLRRTFMCQWPTRREVAIATNEQSRIRNHDRLCNMLRTPIKQLHNIITLWGVRCPVAPPDELFSKVVDGRS